MVLGVALFKYGFLKPYLSLIFFFSKLLVIYIYIKKIVACNFVNALHKLFGIFRMKFMFNNSLITFTNHIKNKLNEQPPMIFILKFLITMIVGILMGVLTLFDLKESRLDGSSCFTRLWHWGLLYLSMDF
jgi:hypothetical protein